MGLFGGSSSKSYSTTIQEDQRVIAEEAEILAGAGANVVVSYPQSVAVSPYAEVGDIVVQPYSPEVRQTVSELVETVQLVSKETIPTIVESFGEAMARTAGMSIEALRQMSEVSVEASEAAGVRASEAGMRTTDILGEKLRETQLGQAAILPGIAKYLVLAGVVIIVAGKVWK